MWEGLGWGRRVEKTGSTLKTGFKKLRFPEVLVCFSRLSTMENPMVMFFLTADQCVRVWVGIKGSKNGADPTDRFQKIEVSRDISVRF